MAALFARSCAQVREDRPLDAGPHRRLEDLRSRNVARVRPVIATAATALAASTSAVTSAPISPLPPSGVVGITAKEAVISGASLAARGSLGEGWREGTECRCQRAARRGAGRGVGGSAAAQLEYRLEGLLSTSTPRPLPPPRPGFQNGSGGGRVMEEGRRGPQGRNHSSRDSWAPLVAARPSQKKPLPPHGRSRPSSSSAPPKDLCPPPLPPNKACAAVRCVSIMETLMEVGGATQEDSISGEGKEGRVRRGKAVGGGGKGGERGAGVEVGRGGRKHHSGGGGKRRRRRERGTTPDWIRRVLEVARRGDVEELSRCLGGMDPTLVRNLSDHSGNNLLHMVAGRGHVAALAWLCGAGSDSANPQSSPPSGSTVPACGSLLEAALLDENRAGLTPIGVAIKNGRVGVVEWLLRQGEARLMPNSGMGSISGPASTISRRLWPGMTISEGPGVGEPSPLHLAAKYGQDRLLRWLLRRSGFQRRRPSQVAMVNPTQLNRTLNRSLDSGLNHGTGDWEERDEDGALWRELLLHSPLHRDLDLKFSQSHGSGVRESDVTPEKSVPGINQRDHRGRTPLHLAAKAGNTNSCRILLSHGADIMLKSELGRKASGCALSRGHTALSSWLALWEAALTLASQLASATEALAEAQKQNQELRGHFREVLMVGKRLAKERDEMCREFGEAVSGRGSMAEHILISRLHKAHFSSSLADMEHRLLLAEQWWRREANGRGRNASSNTSQSPRTGNISPTTSNNGKEALHLLTHALAKAESDTGEVVRVEGVGELSSSSSSASCSSATSSSFSSSSRPSSRASSPSTSCSAEGEDEEERKLMALSLDAVYSEIEEREETRRKSCDFGLLLGIGDGAGDVQEVELRHRLHGLSLKSESGNASVLEVIEPHEDEVGGGPTHHTSQQSKLHGGNPVTVAVGGRRRGRRGRMVGRASQKAQASPSVPWEVVLHRSVSETTINHGVPMEEELGEEERGRGLSVSVEDLLGGGEVHSVGRGVGGHDPLPPSSVRGAKEGNILGVTGGPVMGRTKQGGSPSGAGSGTVEGRISTASHSSASSSSLSANSRPDLLAGTTPRVMVDELALSVGCDVPDVGSESCGETGLSSGSGIGTISMGLLPAPHSSSGLKKRNFLQKLSAKARWPSTKRKKTSSPVGMSPSSHSLTSTPSLGSGSKRSQEISPEDFKETYLSPRITNGGIESTPSTCRESPRLGITSCPSGDCPDPPVESVLEGGQEETTDTQSHPPQTVLTTAPVSPICDRHGSPGSSTGGHRASQVRAELASVAASEDSGIMMVAPPRPSSSASLPSSSSSCYYSAATRAVGAREAAMVGGGGGGVVALEDKVHHGSGHHHRALAAYHLKCMGRRIGSVATEPFLAHPEKALEAYIGRTRVPQQRQKGSMEEMTLPHTPPPPRPPHSPSPLPNPPLTTPSDPAHLSPILSERSARVDHAEETAANVDVAQKATKRVAGLSCDSVEIRPQDVPLQGQSSNSVNKEDQPTPVVSEGELDVAGSSSVKADIEEGVATMAVVDRPWYDLSEEEEEDSSNRGGAEGGGGSSGLSGLSVVRSSSEEDEDGWRRRQGEELVLSTTMPGSDEDEHEGKSVL